MGLVLSRATTGAKIAPMDERETFHVLRWRAVPRKAPNDAGLEILQRLGAGVLHASETTRDGRSRRRFRPAMERRAIIGIIGGFAAGAIAFPWLPGPAQQVPTFA